MKPKMNDRNVAVCGRCNGSGEGRADGTKCSVCKGTGAEFLEGFVCPECGSITETDFGPCPDCCNQQQKEMP